MEHFVERQLKNLEIELDFAKGSKKITNGNIKEKKLWN